MFRCWWSACKGGILIQSASFLPRILRARLLSLFVRRRIRVLLQLLHPFRAQINEGFHHLLQGGSGEISGIIRLYASCGLLRYHAAPARFRRRGAAADHPLLGAAGPVYAGSPCLSAGRGGRWKPLEIAAP